MLSNNKIKFIRALQSKKFRQKYNNFLVEGDKICREVLLCPHIKIDAIYALPIWIETNSDLLGVFTDKLMSVKPAELKKISALSTPNKVIIVAQPLDWQLAKDHIANGLSLYLDGIQDPGNLGTILRIADWFGISAVFCSPDTVDVYNLKVIQASMGAFLRIPVSYQEFSEIRTNYPDLPSYGMVLGGENLFQTPLSKNGIIVIGNEGKGIRKELLNQLDQELSIPAHPSSGAESLNAAIATSIACAIFRNSS